jgi:isopentenyl phosphate kinase
METYILKLGGSAITEKSANLCAAKRDEIRRIAKEIAKAMASGGFRLVVVHGAGPFGHKLVADYGIKDGVRSGKEAEGFAKTHSSVAELNRIVTDLLSEEGINAFSFQPSACMTNKNKKIGSFDTKILKNLLDLGLVPVLYGDMVIDSALGASVVSGDDLVPYLARKLNASRVLLGTDVDGIFTADPKLDRNAKLVEKIDRKNFNQVLGGVGGSASVDVTEGMKGKLTKLAGLHAFIFNITKSGNTAKILSGESIRCTEVKL